VKNDRTLIDEAEMMINFGYKKGRLLTPIFIDYSNPTHPSYQTSLCLFPQAISPHVRRHFTHKIKGQKNGIHHFLTKQKRPVKRTDVLWSKR